jgi:hypothetical protein
MHGKCALPTVRTSGKAADSAMAVELQSLIPW